MQVLRQSHARGKKFIMSNYGVKNDDLEFMGEGEVPTFTTEKGPSFLVKRVVGRDHKTAVFTPGEVQKLASEADKTTVVFVPDLGMGGDIVSMPARLLAQDSDTYSGIKLIVRPHRKPNTGPNGEIMLHITAKEEGSKFHRVNYVPMESMLVYRDFSGHLSMSIGTNGGPDFWLVLRPESFPT